MTPSFEVRYAGPVERALEAYLHEHIPLSAAMGLEVLIASPERVLLRAPLAPNINHRNTAFGGSIACLATLAGWAWMYVMLRERSVLPRIVIKSSTIDYESPADDEFTAELRPPTPGDYQKFIESLDRRGSGRITLNTEVICQGEQIAHFSGVFVAVNP
jgi:thioesterase domain-containing protein